MNDQSYRDLFSKISPSEQLIDQTKKKMRERAVLNRTCRYSFGRQKRFFSRAAVVMAAVSCVFVVSVNASPAFAASIQNLPILGTLSQVLTIRNYTEKTDNTEITVKQPAVADDSGKTENIDVNAQIQAVVDQYLADAQTQIDEYKKAFLETGGTEEEFEQKNIKVDVNYEIKSQSDDVLSFALYMYQSWYNFSETVAYYNLNAQTGEELTLQQLLGDNYIEIANKEIRSQIEERNAQSEYPLFFTDENAFQTINDQTKFYINSNNQVVIVFDKYEIAPGSTGRPEFVIPQEILLPAK